MNGLKDKSRKPISRPRQLSQALNYHVLKYKSEGKGQIDCKYINELPGENFKRKQYAYVDLYSRVTFRKVYDCLSAENSLDFLREVLKVSPFKTEWI